MAKKLDAFLYVCLYVALYFFSNFIAGSIVPLFETLKRVVMGEIGWKHFVERFLVALEIGGSGGSFEAVAAMVLALFLIWLVFLIRRRHFFSAIKHKRLYFKEVASAILIAFGLQAVAALVMKIPFPTALFDAYGRNLTYGFEGSAVAAIIVSGVIAPVFEEVLFRGIIYDELSRGGGFWFSNFFQSLIFGLMHFDVVQGLYAFFIGFSLGGVMRLGKSIYISIIIHILFNVSNLLFASYIATVSAMPYFLVCGVVALVLGYLLLIKKR